MKLVTFTHQGSTRIGVAVGDTVVDVTAMAPEIPGEMIALLAAGNGPLDRVRALVHSAPKLPLAQVKLEPPVLRPPEFLAVGLNYADHVAETGREKPAFRCSSTSSRAASTAPTTRSISRALPAGSITRASWAL